MEPIEADSKSLTAYILTTLVALALAVLVRRASAPNDKIPIINDYPYDFLRRKAYAEYTSNAQGLLAAGVAKYNGQPFRIITPLGSDVILPAGFTEWIKTHSNGRDLDHQALVADKYFAHSPGFEANAVIVDPGRTMINLAKTKMAQSSHCRLFAQHLSEMLQNEWSGKDNDEDDEARWHVVDWSSNVARYVGRMSSAVFAGPELSRNAEWQHLTHIYTLSLFAGVRALRTWPSFLRPIVHWFLPDCRASRAQLRLAQGLLAPTLTRRAEEKAAALAQGREPEKHEDLIEWWDDAVAQAEKRGASLGPKDPAAAQLAFAIAAMHTTSQLLNQVMVDICRHPELIEPLREEAALALAEENDGSSGGGGWSTAATARMRLLDSVIKETQRLKPGVLVNLERKAMRDLVLPGGSGRTLPAGTHLAVDSSRMRDPAVYEDPKTFDGYRFLQARERASANGVHTDGDANEQKQKQQRQAAAAQLVGVSPDHMAFGLGRPVCPGRFMVANEIKVAVATILLGYDVRLPVGRERDPEVMFYGFEMLADPTTKLEVRKRR